MASLAIARRPTGTLQSGPVATSVPERLILAGAAVLATSVLADSSLEHYRGSFANPAMVLPIASSAFALATDVAIAARATPGSTIAMLGNIGAGSVGLAGLAFHVYNVGKRPGGFRLNNFFYKAPLGAPAALILSAVLGQFAQRSGIGSRWRLRRAAVPNGRIVAGIAAAGLAGTVAEAGFLHFRGAFHNPAMWLPVALPPLAAMSLARDVVQSMPRGVTIYLLGATAGLGLIGSAFHAYGISRRMGGWKNWSQNLLAGPPLPAPPAFTGLAIAGLGALLLMRRR